MHDVSFESHNVLADEDIRQGIKEYSNWPTIPQVTVIYFCMKQTYSLSFV